MILAVIGIVVVALVLFVGGCIGYYFGCRDESAQMRSMYRLVNGTQTQRKGEWE